MKSLLYAIIILLSISITNQATADDKPLTGQAKIDSLISELPKAKGDTNEVKLLMSLSYNYRNIDTDKGIKYVKRGVNLAKKINWKKGKKWEQLLVKNVPKRQLLCQLKLKKSP